MLAAFLNVKGEAKRKGREKLTPQVQQWGKTLTTVAELLEALQRLESLLWKEPPQLENPIEWEMELERERVEMSINRMLQNYRFRPVVSAYYGLDVSWFIANKPRISQAQMRSFRAAGGGISNMPMDETAAIKIMLEMAAEGIIERMRRCRCGLWFLATTLKKAVCSDACRFKKYQSKDEYKQERREYMRSYMRNPIVKARRKKKAKEDPSPGEWPVQARLGRGARWQMQNLQSPHANVPRSG